MIRLITPLLLMAALSLGPFSFAQQHRVKRIQREQYTWNNGIVKTDSAVFHYFGANGGPVYWQWAEQLSRGLLSEGLHASNSLLAYDSVENMEDYPMSPYYTGYYRARQQFNSVGQLTDYALHTKGQNGYVVTETSHNTYNGPLLTENIKGISNTKYIYNYQNSVLQRTDIISTLPGSSVFASYYYSYDPAGNLKQVMYAKANPAATNDSNWSLYSYDGQNRLIGSMEIGSYYNGFRDTIFTRQYAYNGNGDLVQQDGYSGPILQPSSKLLSTYDNQHRKTEMILMYSRYPTFTVDTHQHIVFTYDNYGLLTKLHTEQWDNGQWVPGPDSATASSSHTYTFEYEVAWPTGVPEVKEAANVKLYPSPASDFIRIETEWKNAQPFTAAILDMQGRVVRQWDEPGTKQYARTIPLTELPSGTYIIKLNCGEEQYSNRFSVYK
ncbi:T9SS type A sorting domain-containing protein [Polluticoccus soli]|uniref:T9SS type A sorting domain-containing protein n=1 Tax=Polluticoccus soli TaxID=3034150 RepID=UPI0023E18C98|nr:T9SS type A sorting domain-containing protein [Flavipsychrobacter sp. JY13-12]